MIEVLHDFMYPDIPKPQENIVVEYSVHIYIYAYIFGDIG